MKAIAGYLVGVVLLLLVGAACLGVGLLDREIARAEQQVVAEEYVEPQRIFEAAGKYYERASRLPWVGTGAVNDIRRREATLQYWEGQYAAMVSDAADPVANVPADNIDLQFLVANSVYRDAAARATDKATTIAALDAGISAYLTVLKNAARHHDASYNYEYLSRLRDDIEQGRRKATPPPEPKSPQGRTGGAPTQEELGKFKVYIPLDQREIEQGKGGAPGKAAPIKRKG